WLPATCDAADGADRYRLAALRQGMRARRGSARLLPAEPLPASIYLLLEVHAADVALARLLPGTAPALASLRREALVRRPPLSAFAPSRRPLEQLLRRLLAGEAVLPACATPEESATAAAELAQRFVGMRLPL